MPKDQLQIGPDDVLMPVAHFEKEPSRTFGTPFFIKVSNGEKVQLIRERIREMLDVPEKEFEKVCMRAAHKQNNFSINSA